MEIDKRINVFNHNAIAYDRFRPKYPKALILDLIRVAELITNDEILEILSYTMDTDQIEL